MEGIFSKFLTATLGLSTLEDRERSWHSRPTRLMVQAVGRERGGGGPMVLEVDVVAEVVADLGGGGISPGGG